MSLGQMDEMRKENMDTELHGPEAPGETPAELVVTADISTLDVPVGDKTELWGFLTRISRSDLVPAHFRGKPDSMLAAIVMGRELGLRDMQALQMIYVIEGKVTLSANLIRGLIFRAGHRLEFSEATATKCTGVGTRSDGLSETLTWTVEDARAAGLTNKSVWTKFPRQMLKARVTTELARDLFPDVMGWAVYAPEDFGVAGDD